MKLSKTLRQIRLDSLALILVTALAGAWITSATRAQKVSDASLDSVRVSDRADRLSKAPAQLSAAEHLRRASVYMANRAFADARQHWQAVLDNYPNDPGVPAAMFGIGQIALLGAALRRSPSNVRTRGPGFSRHERWARGIEFRGLVTAAYGPWR
jgi:hypothetical protein